MAGSTATNAYTLRRELQKVLPEIFYDGRGKGRTEEACSGVVKAIDEATRILNCLRKIESKKPESNISCSVQVPKEFICPLSKKIMIEPAIIASGQTFEKRYITEWLQYERTCPRTKQVLNHRFWVPNHSINEVIMQWCRVNKFYRPKSSHEVTELFTGDMESLLQRISSPSSDTDQTEAAKELRLKTKRYPNVCVFFVTKIPDSITRLLTPLSVLDHDVNSNPEFLENIVITLFNLSTAIDKYQKVPVAENPHVLPLLAKSMKQGTVETRKNSAATVHLLSDIDSNKLIMGNSEALKALIDVIEEEGDVATTYQASQALYNLCVVKEIRDKAVLQGLTLAVTKKNKVGSIDLNN